jgi:hypothetical protein
MSEFHGLTETEILDAILDGKSIAQICTEIGCNRSMLSRWLAADEQRSARAREARAASAALWDEKATETIELAKDGFELARAKELAHHYRWRASKIAPKEYGDRTHVEVDDVTDRAEAMRKRREERLKKESGG